MTDENKINLNAPDALSLSHEDWKNLLEQWGEPKFRADQICQWIYGRKVFDYNEMSNLSKNLRSKLSESVLMTLPVLIKTLSSGSTIKYLWQLSDGERIESVLLNHGGHRTACISTQVGCPLGCAFCATGGMGFHRNLTAGEILGQFLSMEKLASGGESALNSQRGESTLNLNNIVFMGMGEPFLNEENLFKSIRALNNPKMRNLGARHITISTSGIVPGIEDLADFEVPLRLSVSLHAPNDTLRSKLMPVNKKYPLQRLVDALRFYRKRTGERITIEYILISGVNDDPRHAYELAALLSGLEPYINLIPYNPVSGSKFKRSSDSAIKAFCAALTELHIEFEVRRERGADIAAACGQLAVKN